MEVEWNIAFGIPTGGHIVTLRMDLSFEMELLYFLKGKN